MEERRKAQTPQPAEGQVKGRAVARPSVPPFLRSQRQSGLGKREGQMGPIRRMACPSLQKASDCSNSVCPSRQAEVHGSGSLCQHQRPRRVNFLQASNTQVPSPMRTSPGRCVLQGKCYPLPNTPPASWGSLPHPRACRRISLQTP